MSLIGSLEQFDLANILRRIEVFKKSGLLVVKQSRLWVEIYFRQGQLVCIGPMRGNMTLVDRLLQANLLTQQQLPRVMPLVATSGLSETRLAVLLINDGCLSHETLRNWAAKETSQVLQVIFSWPEGEIYFEEDKQVPADRLLVALSVNMLLDTVLSNSLPATPSTPLASAPRPASFDAPTTNEPVPFPVQQPSQPLRGAFSSTGDSSAISMRQNRSSTPFAANVPLPPPVHTLASSQAFENPPVSGPLSGKIESVSEVNDAQLIEKHPSGSLVPGIVSTPRMVESSPAVSFASLIQASPEPQSPPNTGSSLQSSFVQPQPVPHPQIPMRIDTSFMTPDLVLVPVDLSVLRERNPQVQLTPDEWRLFALIDGHASLGVLCQSLMIASEQICVLAGELIAIGLVMPLTLIAGLSGELSPISRDYMVGGSNNGPVYMPGRGAPMAAPWSPPQSSSGSMVSPPVATQSQWGNGNNGATFMVGGGWMMTPGQGMAHPGQSSSSYAPIGEYR